MDVTTGKDPYGYSPFSRMTTEFVDPSSNPSKLKMPDFQGGMYTWPMPIVSPGGNSNNKARKRHEYYHHKSAPRQSLNQPVVGFLHVVC
jgi:hypothetical protein